MMIQVFILGGILFIVGEVFICFNINKLWLSIMITFIFGCSLMLLIVSVSYLSEKQGAYKQLRNEYTIRYIVDKQGNVCDTTIINF